MIMNVSSHHKDNVDDIIITWYKAYRENVVCIIDALTKAI